MAERPRRSIQQMPNNQRKLSGAGQITNYRPTTLIAENDPSPVAPISMGGEMGQGGGYANSSIIPRDPYRRDIEAYRQRRLQAGALRIKADRAQKQYDGVQAGPTRAKPADPGGLGAPATAPRPGQPIISSSTAGAGTMQPSAAVGAGQVARQTQQPQPTPQLPSPGVAISPAGIIPGVISDPAGAASSAAGAAKNVAGAAAGNLVGAATGIPAAANKARLMAPLVMRAMFEALFGDGDGPSDGGVGGGQGPGAGGPGVAVGTPVARMAGVVDDARQSSGFRDNSQGDIVGRGNEYPLGAVARVKLNEDYGPNKNRAQSDQANADAMKNSGLSGVPFENSEYVVPIEQLREGSQMQADASAGRLKTTSKASWEGNGQQLSPERQKYQEDLRGWREEQVKARGGLPLGAVVPDPELMRNAANVKDEDAFNRVAPYMNPQGPMEVNDRAAGSAAQLDRYQQLTPAMVAGAEYSIESNKDLQSRISEKDRIIAQLQSQLQQRGGMLPTKPQANAAANRVAVSGGTPDPSLTALPKAEYERMAKEYIAKNGSPQGWAEHMRKQGYDPGSWIIE